MRGGNERTIRNNYFRDGAGGGGGGDERERHKRKGKEGARGTERRREGERSRGGVEREESIEESDRLNNIHHHTVHLTSSCGCHGSLYRTFHGIIHGFNRHSHGHSVHKIRSIDHNDSK